jgi:hypothetical protein
MIIITYTANFRHTYLIHKVMLGKILLLNVFFFYTALRNSMKKV